MAIRIVISIAQVRVTNLPTALEGTLGLFRVKFRAGSAAAETIPRAEGPDGSIKWPGPLEIVVHSTGVPLVAALYHSNSTGGWSLVPGGHFVSGGRFASAVVAGLPNEWDDVPYAPTAPTLYARLSAQVEHGVQRDSKEPVEEKRDPEDVISRLGAAIKELFEIRIAGGVDEDEGDSIYEDVDWYDTGETVWDAEESDEFARPLLASLPTPATSRNLPPPPPPADSSVAGEEALAAPETGFYVMPQESLDGSDRVDADLESPSPPMSPDPERQERLGPPESDATPASETISDNHVSISLRPPVGISVSPPTSSSVSGGMACTIDHLMATRTVISITKVRVSNLPAAAQATQRLFRVKFHGFGPWAKTNPRAPGSDGSIEWSEPLEIIVRDTNVPLVARIYRSNSAGGWSLVPGGHFDGAVVTALPNEWNGRRFPRAGLALHAQLSVQPFSRWINSRKRAPRAFKWSSTAVGQSKGGGRSLPRQKRGDSGEVGRRAGAPPPPSSLAPAVSKTAHSAMLRASFDGGGRVDADLESPLPAVPPGVRLRKCLEAPESKLESCEGCPSADAVKSPISERAVQDFSPNISPPPLPLSSPTGLRVRSRGQETPRALHMWKRVWTAEFERNSRSAIDPSGCYVKL